MEGKVVVITGGNAGIGRETAVALARGGARVVFTARNPERGADALADVRSRSGNDAQLGASGSPVGPVPCSQFAKMTEPSSAMRAVQ